MLNERVARQYIRVTLVTADKRVSLGLRSAAVADTGIVMTTPGQYWESWTYKGALSAVASASGTVIAIEEW